MKNPLTTKLPSVVSHMRRVHAFAMALFIALFATTAFCATIVAAEIVPPDETAYGSTYAEHSADMWQWFLEELLENHPGLDDSELNVRSGQRGKVWFLGASPNGMRDVTIPAGKAVFLSLLSAEASNLEGFPFYGATEAEQRAAAINIGNAIEEMEATVDGVPVANIEDYRVTSSQFSFNAPTPWIFGEVGGNGTAVADGYYLLLRPLSKGTHTVHFSGVFRLNEADHGFDAEVPYDVTYNITVK